MKFPIFLIAILANLSNGEPYADNDILYEKAMNMLEQQIQLLRNFVNEVNHAEGLKNTAPLWRGISNVFTDLSGMFGGSGRQHYQYETYGVLPPPGMNTTELARKARIRVEQTRKDIMEMNDRITGIIHEAFGRRPYGNDYHKDSQNRQQDAKNTEKQHDEQLPTEAPTQEQKTLVESSTQEQKTLVESSTQQPADKIESFPVPDGFLPFELSIRGAISREILKEQLYQEEFDMVSEMSPQKLGKTIKPLIAKGQINANVGQCHIAKLLDNEKLMSIEP